MAGLNLSYNSRIGSVANLPTGASYDILMISFPGGFPQSKLVFEIADTPRKVTGIQKVAQTFLKILFTRKGSNVIYPNQGTYFSDYVINANRVQSSDTLLIANLTEQINDAKSQCKSILNIASNQDLASQLKDIELLGVDVSLESVVIYMRLITMAGAMAAVSVPFPQLDLPLTDQISN